MRTPTPCPLPGHPTRVEHLVASGMSLRMIRTYLAAGTLTRIRQGVYIASHAVPTAPPDLHLLAAHAEQVVHPAAVLSHESAAVVWGLPHYGFSNWWDSAPSVTVPGGTTRRGRVTHH
ncbi:MAG: AbiEi antitoxin N-terminal domain-containing protein [Arachnia sp.]